MNDPMIELHEAIRDAIAASLRQLRVCLPAKVVAYNAALATADVEPLIQSVVGSPGEETPRRMPMIGNCPVQFPEWGPFEMSGPLAVGDTVLLVFCDRSIDSWATTGKAGPPSSARAHQLTDAFVVPGFRPFTAPRPARSATDFVVGLKSGTAEVRIAPDGTLTALGPAVNLGTGSREKVARKDDPVAINATTAADLYTWLAAVGTATGAGAPPASIAGAITDGSSVTRSA